jgi:hypothetical protein
VFCAQNKSLPRNRRRKQGGLALAAVDRIFSIVDCKAELELNDKKREHAEYMRKWRAEHLEYTEKQKKACKEWLEKHPDYMNDYNKKWRLSHPGKVSETQRRYKKHHPEYRKKHRARYNEKHPERTKARNIALKKLNPQRCRFCGSTEQIERHHPDYSKPLSIIPLCHSCHVNLHRKKGLVLEMEA